MSYLCLLLFFSHAVQAWCCVRHLWPRVYQDLWQLEWNWSLQQALCCWLPLSGKLGPSQGKVHQACPLSPAVTFVSILKTLKPGDFDTEVEEPMKDCSICVPDSVNTHTDTHTHTETHTQTHTHRDTHTETHTHRDTHTDTHTHTHTHTHLHDLSQPRVTILLLSLSMNSIISVFFASTNKWKPVYLSVPSFFHLT